jgi:hypothetical protein
MKLPNAQQALVEPKKSRATCSTPRIVWREQARFFTHFGFRIEVWETLAQALLEHG